MSMKPIVAFTPEELRAFLTKTKEHDERAYVMFLLMVCHGLRVSEVIALRRRDFSSEDAPYLTVQRLKGSLKTTQKLLSSNDSLFDEMTAVTHYITKLKPKDFLFTNERGEPLTRFGVNFLVTRYGTWAGLPKVKLHPHSLKHSCGVQMRKSGANLELIQNRLGHKKLDSTAMYLRVTEDEVEAAAEKAFAFGATVGG